MSQGFTGSGTSGSNRNQNVNYNTPAATISNKVSDGTEFVLITRSRQSDQPQIWSSGDQSQTQSMLKQVQVDSLETTA